MTISSIPSIGFCLVVFCSLVLSFGAAACTSGEPPASAPASPDEEVAATPTETLTPTAAETMEPTPTPVPTATPAPPTNTPEPTFTPRPRPTNTPRPTPTRTRRPTRTPRPTYPPAPPSPIVGLENGEWLIDKERALANQIANLPWVADGLEAHEVEPAQDLVDLAVWYREVFAMIIRQDWLGDDVNAEEWVALRNMRRLSYYGNELPTKISEKPWFSDGITADEASVIRYLYRLIRIKDAGIRENVIAAAIRVLSMPFLDAVTSVDAFAVRSLNRLANSDTDLLLEVLAHPKLQNGITNDQAKMVALLGGTYSYRPQSGDALLRGTGVYWEERTIELPISGEASLAVVRIRDQSTASMDFLEHSVRTIEEFMGVGLPIDYIALLYDDAVFPGSGGTNFGTHMAMQLLYDVEGGYWWDYTPHTISHEVAHYYWSGNRDWIDEGAAEILGSISEYARGETPIDVTNRPCAAVNTIGELEAIDPDTLETRGFNCNYSLGEQVFLDLYRSLGEETFRQGFRALYLKSLAEDYSDNCEGTELGICHLVAAFKADVSDAQAAQVDEIVARWYGPLP